MYFPLFVNVLCLSLFWVCRFPIGILGQVWYLIVWIPDLCTLIYFCYALLSVHSSFPIILKREKKLEALLVLSYRCMVTINVLWLFLSVPWVGLQCVTVVFPDHTHFPFVASCICICFSSCQSFLTFFLRQQFCCCWFVVYCCSHCGVLCLLVMHQLALCPF